MKIVIIGAGSSNFGRGQIVDILCAPELRGRGVTLSLVDIDEQNLAVMTRFARRVAEHCGSDAVIEQTTDRTAALPGADYVLVAVCRQRYPLWEQDFRVPLAHGFRHCLGENGGPGALFHTLRSLELVIPICRDMERLCPMALLLNFTNPEARVLHAVCHLTKVRAAGICHGVSMGIDCIARLMERRVDELEVTAAGVNHFYAVLKVIDRANGKDILAECKRRVLTNGEPKWSPLFRSILDIFDVFTFPSDDHIGEYLSFGTEYCGVKWHYGQEARKVGAGLYQPWLLGAEEIRAYADASRPIDSRALQPSGEFSVPIIADIELDRRMRRPSVNVLNTDGLIENLPRHGVVEVPALVDAGGIRPEKVGPIPEPFAAFLRTQYAIHQTLTEAYRTGSKKLLLQALLLDPVVNSIGEARRLLDDMLELQAEFLPNFS
jgi:alpha-galactosidase